MLWTMCNPRPVLPWLVAFSTPETQKLRLYDGAMLAGCYFGATGKNNTRQAFVRSVVEKLVELEDDIEWTEAAITAENRLQGLIRFVIFFNALLIVFILSVVAYVFMSK